MFKDKFYIIIATGFGVGKIPFAPGTFGSLLAVLIWILVNKLSNFDFSPILFWPLFIMVLSILGIFAADFYGKKTNKKDAKEIIIDEICGQLITYIVLMSFINITSDYFLIFLGFILFRFFDITKPFIIGEIDKKIKGGIGVMLDDILAGFAAAAFLYIIYALFLI